MANILWLSANRFGYELLQEALKVDPKNKNITGIISLSPDAETRMYDSIDQNRWYETGVPLYLIRRIEEDGRKIMRFLNPDLVIMVGWRQVIPESMLSLPSNGFISTHPTLLPYGRGPAPIINQILEGTQKSGVTLLKTSKELDAGPIIGQEKFEIEPDDHACDVYEKCIIAGKKLIRDYFPAITKGKFKLTPQNESLASVFSQPKGTNRVKEEDNIEGIYRKIKAVSRPYSGAYIEDMYENKLIIWRAKKTEEEPAGIRYNHKKSLANLISDPTDLYFSDGKTHIKVIEGEFVKR